jgi:hypothetical protein
MPQETIKGSWKRKEDTVLAQIVEKYGPKNWRILAKFIPGRDGKQLRARWLDHLDPKVSVSISITLRKMGGPKRRTKSL